MKMMSPNTTVWWIPVAGVANPAAVTIAEINAGVNVSAAIVAGYKIGATASDTDSSKSIVDESAVSTPTFGNYEGDVTFFRSDLTNATAIYDTAFNLFKVPRSEGYFVTRHGKKATQPAATGDEVSIFRFIADSPKDVEGDKGSPIQFGVTFRPQGSMFLNRKL